MKEIWKLARRIQDSCLFAKTELHESLCFLIRRQGASFVGDRCKAQSELLGFVMVVFLVAIGMLFVVGFMVVSARDDVRVDFEDKQMAINLNDALLEVSTECRNTKVKDLLKDCAQDQYLLCGSMTSCQYLESVVVPEVFNKTLDAWGKSYTYEAYVVQGDTELMLIQQGDFATCRQAAVTPGVFYLPLRSGKTVFSELRLCRG